MTRTPLRDVTNVATTTSPSAYLTTPPIKQSARKRKLDGGFTTPSSSSCRPNKLYRNQVSFERMKEHENIAWLDMLFALLQRKYGFKELDDDNDDDKTANEANIYDLLQQEEQMKQQEDPIKRRKVLVESSFENVVRVYAKQIETTATETTNQSCGCKSGCLKLYCRCFGEKGFCNPSCECKGCLNKTSSEQRYSAIVNHLRNNIHAFRLSAQEVANRFIPLFKESKQKENRIGCKCRKTQCVKKYCDCFGAGLACGSNCKCFNCENIHPDKNSKIGKSQKKDNAKTAVKQHDIDVIVTKNPRKNTASRLFFLQL